MQKKKAKTEDQKKQKNKWRKKMIEMMERTLTLLLKPVKGYPKIKTGVLYWITRRDDDVTVLSAVRINSKNQKEETIKVNSTEFMLTAKFEITGKFNLALSGKYWL